MALEATHIRFALDLKQKYGVKDVNKYLSGTIYPDSRYVTKIDRNLTHSDNFTDESFYRNDDFKKGWAVHLICDKLQGKAFDAHFLDTIPSGKLAAGSDVWVSVTALKVLQDMDDVTKFNIQEYLKCLEYVQNPNGEDIEQVKTYNSIFQRMYLNKSDNTVDARSKMWVELGIGEELSKKVKEKSEEYEKNTDVVGRISQLYLDMLAQEYR